ncbi:probable glucan endo-1,3-beta-glucosidase A6 isoform X1 [Physcomitrium patens]|uniref:glucan endo-1,3-beta-D-glucosidase n=2 Tax=Physcomitrium patens TaxID=3218 RepID=A0A7I4E300_PHYPA|nr:probable glucan endo-1,3-beta-glucosidase A6 isoform X1 [Physcomitrium patens]|eukprot:XP_024379458.1 probable glucan endo-1,3-beta-glucosidase A6 isoform X1 [Physcomitrella patens]
MLGLRVGCRRRGAFPCLQGEMGASGRGQGGFWRWEFLRRIVVLLPLLLCPALISCQTPGRSGNAGSAYRMEKHVMGINYGRIADNLPSPDEAIQRIMDLKIGRVKIFNSDATVLSALANTGLEVVSALPNEDIPGVAQSQWAADQWVKKNVLAYYPATNIVSIVVGNELFSYPSMKPTWDKLMTAINNVHTSLAKDNLTSRIKLSSAVALDVLASSYPPSAGSFREELVGPYLQPLLKFLYNSQSHFYVNVYPYFAWASDPNNIPLNYALFGASTPGVVDNGKAYYNMLDGQLDAVNAALQKVGYGQVRLAISETGWPTAGDANQAGCNLANAATYNRRLVRKMVSPTNVGTPMRPGVYIPTFIFALFNEDQKTGQGTEKHWGLLYPNGTNVYSIDMTGMLSDGQYSPLSDNPVFTSAPPPTFSPGLVPSTSGTWCVAKSGIGQEMLQGALDFACGAGGADCQPLQAGGSCFNPNTIHDHSSYAFNSYYQKTKAAGGSCNFGGAAMLSTTDPSHGTCKFPIS